METPKKITSRKTFKSRFFSLANLREKFKNLRLRERFKNLRLRERFKNLINKKFLVKPQRRLIDIKRKGRTNDFLPKKLNLPYRFYSRLGALLFYLIGLAQVFLFFGKPLATQYPIVGKIISRNPVFYLYHRYYNRHLQLIIVLVSHKLFLKRKEVGDYVIIDTPYFLKHHIYHAFLLMINFSLPETFISEFCAPRGRMQYIKHCLQFLMINIICYLPCMINAFFGKYNNLPFISEAVLYSIGDCPNPEEKDGPYLQNVPWIGYSYFKGGRYRKRDKEDSEDQEDEEDDNEEDNNEEDDNEEDDT